MLLAKTFALKTEPQTFNLYHDGKIDETALDASLDNLCKSLAAYQKKPVVRLSEKIKLWFKGLIRG